MNRSLWSFVLFLVALLAPGHEATRGKQSRRLTTSRNAPIARRITTPGQEDVGLDKFVGTWKKASPSNQLFISEQIEQVFAKQIKDKLADLFIVDWLRITSKDNVSFNYEVSSLAFDFKGVKLDEAFSHQEDKNTKINHVFYIKGRSLFYELEVDHKTGKLFSGNSKRQFVQEMVVSQDATKMDLMITMDDVLVFSCSYYDAGPVHLPPGKGKEPKENIAEVIGKTVKGVAVGTAKVAGYGALGTVVVVAKAGQGLIFLLTLPFQIILGIAVLRAFS